ELELSDDADQRWRSIEWTEHLDRALLRQLLQGLTQLLGLHGVSQPHPAKNLRCKARYADEIQRLALCQRIADAQGAMVGDAEHVAGKCLLGERALLRKEELRHVQANGLTGAYLADLHPTGKPAGAQPRKSNAIAVIGIHVGLDLEHERGHLI